LLCSRFAVSPPLFPYTTLFRSCGFEGGGPGGANVGTEVARGGEDDERGAGVIGAGVGGGELLEDHGARLVKRADSGDGGIFTLEDRKSTRLNSSHVSISYAVFC